MWYVLLLAPLLAPVLWSLARPLSWIIIVLPVMTVYSETLSRDDRLSQVYPLEWTDKPHSVPPSRREGAVSTLADLIVRDFVTKWHSILIEAYDDESAAAFPRAVTQLLCDMLHRVLTRVVQLDMSTLLMQRVFPTLCEHVERYRSAQNSLRGLTVSEEDPTFHDWFLATKYQQGELHPAVGNTSSLTTKESEHAHLRFLMNRFIHAFTHDTTCLGHVEAALLREILACSLLYPIIDLITNPDWIHMQIVSRAETRLVELQQVDRVRESLNAAASEPSISRKATLLAYLLEFMDLRGRAMLVRFWILVDTLKDPLEEVERDGSILHAQALMKEVMQHPGSETYHSTRTLQESVELILPYCASPLFQAALALPDVRLSHTMQVFLSDISDGTSTSGSEAEIPLIERMLGSVSELADGIDELVDGFRPTIFDAVVQQILASEDRSEAARGADTSTETRQSYFTEPLCNFLLELFQLKHKSDWLRRRAIVVVLQNLLGSTIERDQAIKSGTGFVAANSNALQQYDVLAVMPLTESGFQHACITMSELKPFSVDIISLDLATAPRLPFHLKRSTVGAALANGVVFEITYGSATTMSSATTGQQDLAAARRNLFSGAREILRATNGKGVIISSAAMDVLGLRGPYDVLNILRGSKSITKKRKRMGDAMPSN
ncbi:ribonuclease P [Malassezia equina]|uniref:Ribonuclease P n=1 Tax=Malassezia equina TaxID=1381935 RepID=A0AAF0EDP2_9BASI|nr:ribonuclease P [Malassezia equina]